MEKTIKIIGRITDEPGGLDILGKDEVQISLSTAYNNKTYRIIKKSTKNTEALTVSRCLREMADFIEEVETVCTPSQ